MIGFAEATYGHTFVRPLAAPSGKPGDVAQCTCGQWSVKGSGLRESWRIHLYEVWKEAERADTRR